MNLETYWEGVEVTPGIVAIEWAQRMPYKPDTYLNVRLRYENENTRQAEFTPFNCTIPELRMRRDRDAARLGETGKPNESI